MGEVSIHLHRAGREHPGAQGYARALVAGDEPGLFASGAERAGAGHREDEAVAQSRAESRERSLRAQVLALKRCWSRFIGELSASAVVSALAVLRSNVGRVK